MTYIPTIEMILTRQPHFNTFYRAPDNVTKYVSQIANAARQNEGKDSSYTFKTIQAMVNSPWNRHIEYGIRGYENYGFPGIQYNKRYSLEPLSTVGSGTHYPVVWIPDPDNPLEPEQIFEPQVIPPVGTDPEIYTEADFVQPALPQEPEPEVLPDEVLIALTDQNRPTVTINAMTQEAQDVAMLTTTIPTEEEADIIKLVYSISSHAAAVIEDPLATAVQKAEAIDQIAQLAKETDLADPQIIDNVVAEANQAIVEQEQIEQQIYADETQEPEVWEEVKKGTKDYSGIMTAGAVLMLGIMATGRRKK